MFSRFVIHRLQAAKTCLMVGLFSVAIQLSLEHFGTAAAQAEVIDWWRFETLNTQADQFLQSTVGERQLQASRVVQVSLGEQLPDHHFPDAFLGLPNHAGVRFDAEADSLRVETESVNDSFTIELFAHIDNLSHPAVQGDAVLAGQWSAVPPGLSRSQTSWVLHVEKEGLPEPELSLSLSDGVNLLEYPSGIVIDESTDYFFGASFDLNENIITYYVQDLATDTLQTVKIEHDVSRLNPNPLFQIGNASDYPFGLLDGIIDEVRFSRGIVPIEDLLVNQTSCEGDLNHDGILDAHDIDLIASAIREGGSPCDLNSDGIVDQTDHTMWVKDLQNTWFGDANLDGEFSSLDFVVVFQAGKFETGQEAGWSEGDWNGDGIFSSGDFVTAFQDGGYEQGPRVAQAVAVPEPATNAWLVALTVVFVLYRRQL